MVVDSFTGIFAPGCEGVAYRLAVSAWCLTTLLAPAPLARRLIAWRFA